MKIKKFIIVGAALLLTSFATVACWYQSTFYTDYISSVNDAKIIQTNMVNEILQYQITNNTVVDMPLTISVKLISDQVISLTTGGIQTIPEILRCSLQYRILPGGEWNTVANYNTPSGTIDKDSVPNTYFGKNNIWPKNLKAGDVIMIRMYVTDGMWESGKITDMCNDKLTTVSTKFGNRISLPNSFSYLITSETLKSVDLGGGWYPHFVITVIYSGNERPVR